MTQAPVLLGEPHVIDDIGPPAGGRSPGASARAVFLLAPLLVVTAVVVVPLLLAVYEGLSGQVGDPFEDRSVWWAVLRTFAWAVLPPLLVVSLAYLVAVGLGRGRLTRVVGVALLVPTALPLLVVGVAFRLLLDQTPYPGSLIGPLRSVVRLFGGDPDAVPAPLGPGLVMVSLMVAFCWCWLGLAVLVLRRALDRIPAGVEETVRVEGGRFRDVFRHVHLPHLRGVLTVLIALLAVASGRSFDLVLMAAPGLSRDEAETLAVYLWWRAGQHNDPAVVPVLGAVWLLVVAVGVAVAVGVVRLLARWLSTPRPPERDRDRPPRRARMPAAPGMRRRRVIAALLPLWLLPLLLVLGTSAHDTVDAARTRWVGPLSAGSYASLFTETSMGSGLLVTFLVAGVATLVAVAIGLVGGYALAWYQPPGSAALLTALFAAAVIPIQILAPPLHAVLDRLGLTGTLGPFFIVHIGLGVSIATLVLREAFAAVAPQLLYLDRLYSTNELMAVVRTGWNRTRSSVVSVAVLLFVLAWSDIVVGLFFSGTGVAPAGLVLLGQARDFDTNVGMISAGAVVFAAVPVSLVLLARRGLVEGLASGVARR